MAELELVHNARVAAADGREAAWIRIDGGCIAAVGDGAAPAVPPGAGLDVCGAWVLPGFVDVHVHGAAGVEVMDGRAASITTMATTLARHGVTAFVPSTVTSTPSALASAVASVAAALGPVEAGARVIGAHLEGPWISDVCRGAHPPQLIRSPDPAEVAALLGSGAVASVTLAPELEGADALIAAVRDAGAIVVVGHTDATAAQVHAAADAGATHVTHLFNGMRGFHHREPGTVGAALIDPRLTCEVIADGIHVADDALRLAWTALGPERMVLVTDANAATGLGDGTYDLARRRVHVVGARATLDDGTIAGSVMPMDAAFARLCQVLDTSPLELWPVASRNPARAVGLGDRIGEIAVGRDADLVVLDADLAVTATVLAGRTVPGATDR